MSSVLHDCPYCGSKSAAFEIVREIISQSFDGHWVTMVRCGVCKQIALATLLDNDRLGGRASPVSPLTFSKDKALGDRFQVLDFVPSPPELKIANAIPENVEVPLREAEQAFSAGLYTAAGSCYRKAVERALKAIDPELKGMLNARIRQLEKQGLLPPSMIELLDQVRLFGNASMHEDDIDPSREDCATAREFCDLFLTYTFSLPAKVAGAREKAASEAD